MSRLRSLLMMTSRNDCPRVLVVGDVMTDVVARREGPLAPGSDRRAAIRITPGGSAANQAAWLAHSSRRHLAAGGQARYQNGRDARAMS